MLDFHSQIISNEANATELARSASKAGFKKLVATATITDQEDSTPTFEETHKKFLELNKVIVDNNIEVEAYLANEIYYSDEVVSLLKASKVHTINNTQYVLLKFDEVEASYYTMIEAAFKLQVAEYHPMISHIEKYACIINNPNQAKDLIHRDILLQMDILSITGAYGKNVQKTAKSLLKNNLIHTLGTNITKPEDYKKVNSALKKIKRIVGKKRFLEISKTNGEQILKNEELSLSDTIESKKKLFKFKTA